MYREIRVTTLLMSTLLLLTACNPVSRRQFLVTFFNDVPALPPVEDYCSAAAEKKARLAKAALAAKDKPAASAGSSHPPYAEKRCNDCHQAEKTSVSGLIKPETELCFLCHPRIIKGVHAHGPAAEGGCLSCHLPHEANYPSLLIRDPGKLCDKCHSEPRLAAEMHDRIKASGVTCIDCHDPHSGSAKYFLK